MLRAGDARNKRSGARVRFRLRKELLHKSPCLSQGFTACLWRCFQNILPRVRIAQPYRDTYEFRPKDGSDVLCIGGRIVKQSLAPLQSTTIVLIKQDLEIAVEVGVAGLHTSQQICQFGPSSFPE